MSKLAKKSIPVPAGVTVVPEARELSVKGPKGELTVRLPAGVALTLGETGLKVSFSGTDNTLKANVGTAWSLARNAILGVTDGYTKGLELEGVGYKAAMEGDTLVLSLGFVNPVRMKVPKGLAVTVEKNTIKVVGIDKELVGQFAAEVRSKKKPEPYKGKGIRYSGEVIRRKVGKKATTSG